ncbi:MAG TPA: BTAD domain-containing putative transcriptional regulator [Rubrobacteraceae bacterium]|nr:BTAD domain-containing putative transcriptional regulator [Rubrobacteraceae bacterium]
MGEVSPYLHRYYVERDQDLATLHRVDGSLVAAFRNRGTTSGTIGQAAQEAGDGEVLAGEVATATSLTEPKLRVNFFGRFEFLRDGEVVSLGRNARALAILKYLLAHRTHPVPQDCLMGWLWPESEPKKARWSLNSAICALRKLLKVCLPSLSASETVLLEGGRYRLSPQVRFSADTDEFDSCYEKGCRLEEAGRVPEAVAEYEKAVGLYRGDYLIEDLYEDWTTVERQRLLDAYIDLLRRLATRYIETGKLRGSVRICYLVLEKDRCDEDAHRLLMECFARLGKRARALRQYNLCEQALGHEYLTTPSSETQALYKSILT